MASIGIKGWNSKGSGCGCQGSGSSDDAGEGTILVEGEPSKFMFLGDSDPTPQQQFAHLQKHIDWAFQLATTRVFGGHAEVELYVWWAHKLFHHLRIASNGLARLVKARVQFATEAEVREFVRKSETVARVGVTLSQLLDQQWRVRVDAAAAHASRYDWETIRVDLGNVADEYLRQLIEMILQALKEIKPIVEPLFEGLGIGLVALLGVWLAVKD
jgi:hypothetical protein